MIPYSLYVYSDESKKKLQEAEISRNKATSEESREKWSLAILLQSLCYQFCNERVLLRTCSAEL